MKKQLWLIVGIALTLPACGVATSPECDVEPSSSQVNPCSPISEPAQAPVPSVGDPNDTE